MAEKKPYSTPHLVVIRPATRIEYAVIVKVCGELVDSIEALRALLAFWDLRDESGWTAADVERLAEIRTLVANHSEEKTHERAKGQFQEKASDAATYPHVPSPEKRV